MTGRRVLIALLILFAPQAWSADASAGQANYALCIACHGAKGEGNKALNSPAIAGQESWYLETQLKNFKEGHRGAHPKDMYGGQMRPMAMTLTSDAVVANVAAYTASLAPTRHPTTVTGDPVKGKQLYAICMACHGPDAKGLKIMNSPNLTLQQDWYMVRQLQNFKSGVRGTAPGDILGMQMRPMALTLQTDQDINDVVSYIMLLAN